MPCERGLEKQTLSPLMYERGSLTLQCDPIGSLHSNNIYHENLHTENIWSKCAHLSKISLFKDIDQNEKLPWGRKDKIDTL